MNKVAKESVLPTAADVKITHEDSHIKDVSSVVLIQPQKLKNFFCICIIGLFNCYLDLTD